MHQEKKKYKSPKLIKHGDLKTITGKPRGAGDSEGRFEPSY